MPFLALSPVHFRNLDNKTIDLLAREVYFVGENGQGKSNLLESLYYSAYASSFRTHSDSEIVTKGFEDMKLRSLFREEGGISHTTAITFEKGVKRIERDGKMIKDRKELINAMPCVLYSHDDLDFAVGSPERRRFFIDQSLSMYDVSYLDAVRRYKRVLKNRNHSLKEGKYDLLEPYNTQLAINGIEIQKKRKDAVFRFNQIFGSLYEDITGISGLSIQYESSWKKRETSAQVYEESASFTDTFLPSFDEVMSIIHSKLEVEKYMFTTMTGPHRDKITFTKDSKPFVPTASTGQRRLIALLLRTAQAIFYTQVTKRKPVLLMDDVLLELDPDKREKVEKKLPEYEQLFCTFLPGEPYERYRKEGTRVYRIKSGMWEEEK